MKLSGLFKAGVLSAALVLFGTAQNASAEPVTSSTSSTATATVGGNYIDISLPSFDVSLGTLTGVTVTVNYATLQGSITVSNTGLVDTDVTSIDSTFYLRGATAGLGLGAAKTFTLSEVSTSPASNPSDSISPGNSVTFTYTSGQNFTTNTSYTITSPYWSAYETSGSGTVTLQSKETNTVSTSGDSYGVDSKNTTAVTSVTVTYTYTAVPEPSTWAMIFGGVATLVVVQRVRRHRTV